MFSQGYFIDSQICIILLYVFYRAFLEGRINHHHARSFLLMMIPLAMIFPAINIPLLPAIQTFVTQVEQVQIQFEEVPILVDSPINYLLIGYLTGVGLMMIWLLIGMIKIIILLQKSRIERVEGLRVIFTDQRMTAYSVFHYIFVNAALRKNDLLHELLAHEECHIRLRHTLDLLFVSIIRTALWFNPLVWHTSTLLRQVHEYQADENVINQGYSKYNYINLLILSEAGINPEFASPMSYSLTKKRLKMLAKKEQAHSRKRLMLTIPLLAIMVILFSLTRSTATPVEPKPPITSNSDSMVVVGYGSMKEAKDDLRKAGVTKITYKGTDDTKKPLIIVDGKEWNKSVEDISPESIDNISILKDAVAVDVYGGKGKNGVIVIALKENTSKNEVVTVRYRKRINNVTTDSIEVRVPDKSKQPLIMVDGREWKKSLNDISPETIESMTVLKDEAAQKVYGEKAKDGIILITLKKSGNSDILSATEVEVMPKFEGQGIENFSKWVSLRLKYPESCAQGSVIVSFVINTEGQLVNAKVVRGVHEDLNKETLDVVKTSPLWTPGKNGKGEVVSVAFTLPIKYVLQ